MIEIFGGKGKINNVEDFLKKIQDYSKKNNILIQVFDAEMIFGKKHLISAINHATRSIKENRDTTNSLEMEIILYASGMRQLKNAIPKMGVKKGESKVTFVFLNDYNNFKGEISEKLINEFLKKIDFIRDDKIIEGDINTLKKFGLSNREIGTVAKSKYQDLILEKVAMVDIIK